MIKLFRHRKAAAV